MLLSLFAQTLPALAANVADEAEAHFQLGARAYQAGDYQLALVHFMQSNRLAPNGSVQFNIARSYVRLKQYPEAYRWYVEAKANVRDPAALATIEAELNQILPSVSVLTVQSTPPGATVYLDRRDLGAVGLTPLTVALNPGEHRVIVELDGHRGWDSGALQTRQGAEQTLVAPLAPIVGRLSVQTAPGVKVHKGAPDGPLLCTAPCDLSLSPGNYLLFFRQEGFRDELRQVELSADQISTLSVSLAPKTGSVLVSAEPVGALIEIDGVAVGYAPTVLSAVPVGAHTVRLSRRGYAPEERRVTVEDGRQVSIAGVELSALDEVTAVSRLPESIENAPSSVTLISNEEIRAFGYPTLYEALRGVRGAALTYDSVYSSVAVRGLGEANDFGNRLLILSDGATLNDNILYQSFVGYDGRVDLGDVDHIEVVRGPGSVLYGTGAVSGVVNLVGSPIDAPQGQSVSIGANGDSVARVRVATHHADGDRGFRASASAATSEGRAETLGQGNEAQSISGFDQFRAATTAGRVWAGDATLQWFGTTRQIEIPTGAYGTVVGDDRTVWRDDRAQIEARYEPRLSDQVRLFTRAFGDLYQFRGSYAYDDGAGGITVSREAYLGVGAGAEARVVFEPRPGLRMSAGGELRLNPIVNLDGYERYTDGTTSTYLDESQRYTITAGYALIDLAPTPWFSTNAGVRLDWWSTFGPAVSPRMALIFKPSPNDTVKLLGGRAFRAPSPYELFYNVPGVQNRPETLDPEKVWSGELEYNHRLSERTHGVVAVYSSLAEDIVTTVVNPDDGAVVYQNSEAPVRTVGGDVEVRRSFRDGWMASANYGWLDARTLDGAELANAPNHFAAVKVVAPIVQPYASLAARASLEAPRRVSTGSGTETNPALVADLVLSGAAPETGLSYNLGVYNVFNQRYALPMADNFAVSTMPQAGRTLLVSLSYSRAP